MAAAAPNALELVSQFAPGSAQRAAAALLAPLGPRGLSLSEIQSRALALDLFTPQPPPPGCPADVAAWGEMAAALMSDKDTFVVLRPGIFGLRAFCPRQQQPPAPQPPEAPLTPLATLSDAELEARLEASPSLRAAAQALVATPHFHRAAREAREAGDATVLAHHLATLRLDNPLLECPEVFLALANRDFPGAELAALWKQHYAAARDLGALSAERASRIAAETRAAAAEAREEQMVQRAVAMLQRAGLDPYELLFVRGEDVAGEPMVAQDAYDDFGLQALLRSYEPEKEAPRADAAAPATAPLPAAEGGVCSTPLAVDADVEALLEAPEAPPDEPATAEADVASGGEPVDALAAPPCAAEAAHEEPAGAEAGPAAEDVPSVPPSPPPPELPPTGAEPEQAEEQRKRAASEPTAEESPAKAARTDAGDEPLPDACGGVDSDGDAAAVHLHEEDSPALQDAPGGGSDVDGDAPLETPTQAQQSEGAAPEEQAAGGDDIGMPTPAAELSSDANSGDANAEEAAAAAAAAAADATIEGAADGAAPEEQVAVTAAADKIGMPTPAAEPSPDASSSDDDPEDDDAAAAAAATSDGAADIAADAPSPPPPAERVCLCEAVLSECEARRDVLVRCNGCHHRFHPRCCGYPASLTAAEAEAMRPQFACYDHLMFFPADGGTPVPAGSGAAKPAAPEPATAPEAAAEEEAPDAAIHEGSVVAIASYADDDDEPPFHLLRVTKASHYLAEPLTNDARKKDDQPMTFRAGARVVEGVWLQPCAKRSESGGAQHVYELWDAEWAARNKWAAGRRPFKDVPKVVVHWDEIECTHIQMRAATAADCICVDRAAHPGKLFVLPPEELAAILSEFDM